MPVEQIMEGVFNTISLTYKDTPLEVREMVAMQESESNTFLMKLREVFSVEEAMLVSTCNRTEIYYSSESDLATEVVNLLASTKAIDSKKIARYFQKLDSNQSVKHLFRVSLGLESQVLGDIQISNQVKKAYQQSADLNLAGPHLHRLMHTIFFANKRVVQETRFQDGTASVASVATDLTKKFTSQIAQPRVAIIGLGEIGLNILDNIEKASHQITLINRTKSKAEAIANENGFLVNTLENIDNVIQENDVIISAISTNDPLITSKNFDKKTTHKLLIDVSVPRSIDPAIEQLAGILLFNVDQLTEKTRKTKKVREQSIPAVEAIIEETLQGFENWKSEMDVSPTIQKLKNTLDQIRKEELARYTKASESEMKLLEVATKNMVQKVMKLPVLQLKAACKRGEADRLVDVLNDLFDLEKEEVKG